MMLPEGLVKTIVNNGDKSASSIERGDIVTVKYTCYSASSSSSSGGGNVLLARSDSQKTVRFINKIINNNKKGKSFVVLLSNRI
jgi:hypothetical protein